MERKIDESHPLWGFLSETLSESLEDRLLMRGVEDVREYLAAMLVDFLSYEGIYRLRNSQGQVVKSLSEMLAEADVRLEANSFDREREVHQHIGDFLLFWSGLFPECLDSIAIGPNHAEAQGKQSYYVVSTFEFGRYADDAPVFKKLSEGFDDFQEGLRLVRKRMPGLKPFQS
ncbi:MAG: hypothetical protein JSS72_03255 [Armatimonadetes bacterium]|nr:hypothetical protein [Armatimonadota bacterium]